MKIHAAGKSLFAVLALVLMAPAALADESAERGRRLAYTCMGCHGIENYKNA